MRRFAGAAVAAGIMLIGPGCSGEILGEERADPVIEAEPGMSDGCDALTDQTLPGDFRLSDAEAAAGMLYEQTQRDIEGARQLAIDDALEEATLEYESLARLLEAGSGEEAGAGSFSQAEVETIGTEVLRFLADPEGAQTALKAICAAYAGEVIAAEELLDDIDRPETRYAYEDDVEAWQGKAAEDRAINETYDSAYEILPLIGDDTPKVKRLQVQDDIEYWIAFNAERAARNGEPERAREMIKRIDEIGSITHAAASMRLEKTISEIG